MATTVYSIPQGTYTGSLNIPSVVLPSAVGGTFQLRIECSQWLDSSSSTLVMFQISHDSGATWEDYFSCTFYGASKDRQGNPLTTAFVNVGVPSGPIRVKGSITIVGSLVTNGITVVE